MIIGAGSVGGYIGAKLQMAKDQVTFIVREKRREQLTKGLNIVTPEGRFQLNVDARTSTEDVEDCDVAIIAVRNYNLPEVIDHVRSLAKKGAKLISLLNGVEHIEKISAETGKDSIIGGSAYIDSRLGANGEIIHRSQRPKLVLGQIQKNPDKFTVDVADDINRAGIHTIVVDDLMLALWQKYLFVTSGSLTAVFQQPIGKILEDEYGTATIFRILNEMKAIGSLLGVKIGDKNVEEAYRELKRQKSDWTSLLYEDLLAGRKTEMDALWGYLIRKARELQYDAMNSLFCYAILRIRERSRQGHSD